MITSVDLLKNNSIYFKGSKTQAKTVSAPIKNAVNNEAKTVSPQIKDAANNETESSKKSKKVSKVVGLAVGTALASAILLKRPIKRHIITKEVDKIEKTINKEIEEKVSFEIKKYNNVFEKTKAAAKAEVKDLLKKSKKDSSLVDKLTDGEINTIVAAKKNLTPIAIPILIDTLAKTPDDTIEILPAQDPDLSQKFDTYLSYLEKTSEKPLEYVDSENKREYELKKIFTGYGYSIYNDLRFVMENSEKGCNDIRNLGIVLDSDKKDNKKYLKLKNATFAAVIINNILYKNEANSNKEQVSKIIKICKNNEQNEKNNYQKNCDFIANDIREEGNRRTKKEKQDRIRAEKEKARIKKESIKQIFCSDNTNTQNNKKRKKDSFNKEDVSYYYYMKSKEEIDKCIDYDDDDFDYDDDDFDYNDDYDYSYDDYDDGSFDDGDFDDGGMY